MSHYEDIVLQCHVQAVCYWSIVHLTNIRETFRKTLCNL